MSIADSTGCASARCPSPSTAPPDRSMAETQLRDARWLKVQRTLNMTVAEVAVFLGKPYRTVARGIKAAQDREARAEAEAAARAGADLDAVANPVAALVAPEADLTPEERTALAESSLDLDDLVDFRKRYGPGSRLGDNPVVVDFCRRLDLDGLLSRKRVDGRDRRPTLVTNTISAGAVG